MANQSFLSVPPNVEDPVVLRRFLSRMLEQLDIATGNRGGDSLYSEQQALIKSAESLSNQLAQAQSRLDQAIQSLSQVLNEDYDDVIGQLNGLNNTLQQAQTDISALEEYTAIKGFVVRFSVDALNALVYDTNYNINTSTSSRTAAGVYQFNLSQNTYFGQDVLPNCSLTVATKIATNAASHAYVVEPEFTATAGQFELKVYELIISGTNVIERQAYDLQVGDVIHVTGLFNLPGSSLPGV